MRVLLTGGSGQVGTAIQRAAPAGMEVVAPSSREFDVSDGPTVERWVARVRPEVLINTAAYTAVDRAEDENDRAWAVNAMGAENVAKACAANRSYLIQLSTDYVFDGAEAGAYREEDVTNPLNVYGRSKRAGEVAALRECASALVLRLGWIFSETGQNFVKTILRLARERGALSVVNDQWGTPTSAESVADTVFRAVLRRAERTPLVGVYHFASRPVTTWFQFACEIVTTARALGALEGDIPLTPIDSRTFGARASRPARSVLDSTQLCRALGVEPPDWRQDLRSIIGRLASMSSDARS